MTEEDFEQIDKYLSAYMSFQDRYEQVYPKPKLKLGYRYLVLPFLQSFVVLVMGITFLPEAGSLWTVPTLVIMASAIVLFFRNAHQRNMGSMQRIFNEVELLSEDSIEKDFSAFRESNEVFRGQKRKNGSNVYLMESGGWYKIGHSQNPEKRRKDLSTASPLKVQIVHSFPVKNPHKIERRLHEKYSSVRGDGEWFALSPEDVEEIKQMGDTDAK